MRRFAAVSFERQCEALEVAADLQWAPIMIVTHNALSLRLGLFGAAFCFSALSAACGGAPPATVESPPSMPATHAPSNPIEAQSTEGAKLYAQNCASCHGAKGEGGKAPQLVGGNALPVDPRPTARVRKDKFQDANDVFTFVKATMPMNRPASLSDTQYWAIVAYDFRANGFSKGEKVLDSSTAPTFLIPR